MSSDGWRKAQCKQSVMEPSPFINHEMLADTHAVNVGRFLTSLKFMTFAGVNEPPAAEVLMMLNWQVQCLAYKLGRFYSQLIGGALNEAGFGGADAAVADRALLSMCCATALSGILPGAREGDEVVMVPMPARLATKVVDAIDALNVGEVPELFAAQQTGRHEPHTRGELRVRALQHVEFLRGQGLTKAAALNRVSLVTAVPDETLRGWARSLPELYKLQLLWAFRAGEAIAAKSREPIDADVDVVLSLLRAEPLSVFGKRYQRAYGKRHNPAEKTGGN